MRLRLRAVAAGCAALLLFATSCRKDETAGPSPAGGAAPAAVSAPPVEEADAAARQPRPAGARAPVIWLGLDGLDWALLSRLSAEGKMPNWTRLVAEGFSADLESFFPVLSPILWTTAATGVGPDVHRVLDFQESDPKTGAKLPVSGFSRAVPAAWNLASQAGRKVGVVGWWATHPAEEVNGFFVSDRASPLLFSDLPRAGVAYPASLAAGVEQVIVRDGVVSDAEVARFVDVPAAEIASARASGAGMENPIVALSRIVSATRINHRIARDLYDRNLPDLMVLYLQGTDEIGHVFAPYVPPRLDCTSEADFARYKGTTDAYYALVDRVLGQWMRRAKEDGATLIVHSDHGFKWGEDRTCARSSANWATAAYWHRINGVFAAWGAKVRPSKSRTKATLFDVAPTVLALSGLPADRRMTGKAVTAGFEGLASPPKEDLFSRATVRRVAAQAATAEEATEYAKKLRALGYLTGGESAPVAPAGGDRPGMTEGAWNNLGVYLRETRPNLAAAESALLKSLELRPGYSSPMFNLSILYRMRGEEAKARDWLFRSLAAGHAEPERTIATWVVEYQTKNKLAAARALLEEATKSFPANEPFARELSLIQFRARQCPEAYATLSRFEAGTADTDTLNALGLFQTCLGRREEALRLFERSLALNANQPAAVRALEVVRRGLKE
ncbi:MAG TPA: alkaline phosphatase family protein [Thermoanaerobaculia bacterium]|nr:alkaline phosphatase family protein [Thermoanaerobaculia bacterium]